MKKRIALLMLALLLTLSMAACGSSAKPEPAQEPDAAEKTQETAETPEAAPEAAPEETPAEDTTAIEPERNDTDALTWEFDAASGTLSIYGEGPMRDYSAEPPEWEVHKDEILAVKLDEGITSVGAYAFFNYTNLAEITLPDSVAVIDTSAFDYDWSLRTITIPASLRYVGERAFYNTLLWEPENLIFPEGCEYIGDEAFHSALKSGGTVSLPASLRHLGEQSFTNAYLSDFVVAEGNETYCSENHAIYTKDKKQLLMLAPVSGLTEFSVPDGVERICAECFNVIQGVETVTIPASVTEIAEGAFFSTFDLREIRVDEANPNYRSENGLLLSRDGTLLLAWPDGIEGSELVIPEGVERLGAYLLYGRIDGSYTVVLPEGVKELGTMCLPQNMASLSLPSSLEKIDDSVFYSGIQIGSITYHGTAEDWQKVLIEDGNTGLNADAIQMN